MKIVWQDFPMREVVSYFAKGFDQSEKIVSYEWFYDSHKERLVLRLVVKEKTDV